MSINFTDFSRNHIYRPENADKSKAIENALNKYRLMNAPQNMAQEQRKLELANAFAEMQNQFYKPKAEADILYKKAMIEKAMRDADLGGLSGNLGNAAKLYKAEQTYGSNHPLVQKLKQIQQFEQDRERGILDMQRANMAALPTRLLTNEGRTLNELSQLKQGNKLGTSFNGGPEKLSSAESAFQRAQYEMGLLNKRTDPALRDRLRASADIHTTLGLINPEQAFRYSGVWGSLAKKAEKSRSSLSGEESEQYAQYEENLTRLHLLAKQFSRFFGAGAAEGIQKDIEYISNPNSWNHSPQVAERKFKALIDLFEKESTNLHQAAGSPEFYGAKSPDIGATSNISQENQGEGRLGLIKRIRLDQEGRK
ncbi:MAG: hypothetical protein [Caudoviricetes sp.]|nr:MAG: hypothetical protein [Caudoviricetes sp.]